MQAEIDDAGSVDMETYGGHVFFRNGKFMWVVSPEYHAGFHANFVTEEEFFNVMVERGGCKIEVDAADYAVSPDAQDSAVDAEIKTPETEESLRKTAREILALKIRLVDEQEWVECTRENLEYAQKWMREAAEKFGIQLYAEQAEAIDATIKKLNERIAELAVQVTAVEAELATVKKKIADFKHAA